MMQATNLKTNHLTQPLGIDAGTLFLSWQCAEGVRQTAYEIEVTAGAETLWTSGKILSSMMHPCAAQDAGTVAHPAVG
mgnify:CR=1 FL=1